MCGVPVSVNDGQSFYSGSRIPWNPAWNKKSGWAAASVIILIAGLVVWRFGKTQIPASESTKRVSATAPVQSLYAKNTAVGPVSAVPVNQGAPAAKSNKGAPVAISQTLEIPEATRITPFSSQQAPVPGPQVSEPVQQKHPHSYKTATEGLIAMAMSVPPGEMVPPLPISKDLDMDFVNSLSNEIVIYDDDDDRTANIKENVAVTKNQLLELVKQGRSVSEVLKEYEKQTNERAAIRSEAQVELSNLIKNGSTKEAKAYLENINKAFGDLGIEPITLPRARALK